MAVKPFNLKGLFNVILNVLISILARGPDGLPSAHAKLSRSLPSLEQDPLEGVLVVKMFVASFGPEIVEQEAPEDIERLSPIGEAARVVAMKVRGVVLLFVHGFTKRNEGPNDVGAVGHLPFVPYAEEGIPGLLSRDAFHEAVLGGLRESLVAIFVGSLDSHGLEPGTHQQPVVKY